MIRAHVLREPPLEFRPGCRHPDPRIGLSRYGPADIDAPDRPTTVTVGFVGPAEHIAGLQGWLHRCCSPIAPKAAKPGQEKLHVGFPGFRSEEAFHSQLVSHDSLVRAIPERELRRLATPAALGDLVDSYAERVESLSETGRCDVIMCCRPDQLDEPPADQRQDTAAEANGEPDESASPTVGRNFHDLLKARTLSLAPPLQVIRRHTWAGKAEPGGVLQDEATRAWNLHVALYYKAGGSPWRLPRHSTDQQTCFVGVSFYRSSDGSRLRTAVAQVFNELGDGVVVRGGPAVLSKDDPVPHLDEADARKLLVSSLSAYRRVHGHQPARVVLHKSSGFSMAETVGFEAAADEKDIDHLELIWLSRQAPRFFRHGQLPPMRCTTVQLDRTTMVVYTRGSVELFRTYPGMYVPQPLLIRAASDDVDLRRAAIEILGLSKMNWNNAQLDERDPLTIRTARRVGDILRHVPDSERPAMRYAKYM